MSQTAFLEPLLVRFPKGAREQIQKAAKARARRIGVAAALPMSEFVRSAVTKAIEEETNISGEAHR